MSFKKYIIKSVSGILIIKIIGMGFSLFISVVFARAMGPSDYGLYSFAMETMLFLSIPVTLGFPKLLTREVSKYYIQRKYGLLKGLLHWSSFFVFIASIIIILIATISILIFEKNPYKIEILIWALPIIILSGLSQVRMGSLQGLKKIFKSQFPDTVIRPITIVCIFAILHFKWNTSLNALLGIKIYVFSVFVAFIFGFFWLIKALSKDIKKIDKENSKKEWIKEAFPFFMIGSILLINTKLSMVLVGFYQQPKDVGFYKIAVLFSSIISFTLNAVNTSLGPVVSEIYSTGEEFRLQKILTKSVRIVFTIGILISLIYIFFGKFLLNNLYGEAYLQAYFPLLILTIGQLINVAAGSVGTVLNMTGYQRDVVKGQFLTAIINIILNLILLPLLGIIGAALATSISLIVWNIILVKNLKIRLNLRSSIFG